MPKDKISVFKLGRGAGKPRELIMGRGTVFPLIDEKTCGAKSVDVHHIVLRPGVDHGRIHYHKDVENIYLILEGKGEILTGEVSIPVGAGDIAYIPPGVPHEPHNTGKTELKLVEIKVPQQDEDDFHVVKTF